ncbi:MAG: hypothetical protein A3E01_00190 [Gammaproteobacteria bacterium RIFCSPHIGHO2_12_FULL_63_22]|nr:MAG: hypothetical protein A3E01_00190 [Gammaproteobacteria bacterium RIFCSPHIGHO2_12_FULL_63_22]
MCAPDPPPPPDYAGAAQAQGAANIDAARATAKLSNPNVINPYGTQTVTYGVNGDQDQATVNQTFSPEQQALYDNSVQVKGLLGGLGVTGATALQGVIGKNLDLSTAGALPTAYTGPSDLPDVYSGASARPAVFAGSTASPTVYAAPGKAPEIGREVGMATVGAPMAFRAPDALDRNSLPTAPTAYTGAQNLPGMPQESSAIREQVINAMMGRVDTDIARSRDQSNSDLIANGIRPGTEAYDRAMQGFDRQRTDALQQAQIAGGNAAQQAFTMDLSRRQQGYNETTGDAALTFNQGMGLRTQAVGEQGQEFNQRLAGTGQEFNQKLASTGQQIQQNQAAAQLAAQQREATYQAQLASAQLEQARQAQRFSQGMSLSQLQAAQQAQQFGQGMSLSQLEQAQQAQQFGQGATVAQMEAAQQAQQFGQESDLRRQSISEILAQRQTPLNEINALMSGSQVSNPFASNLGYQAGANVAPPPIMGAAQAQGAWDQNAYAQGVGQSNAMMSGLFSIGSAAAGNPKFSDRRLKRDIRRIGTHPLGIGRYAWTYLWGEDSTGVMADEVRAVMPAAVVTIGGYDAVDYAMIGGA